MPGFNFRSEREKRSALLSMAISIFEARHSGKWPDPDEKEIARKAYCLGIVEGCLEALEQMMPDFYEDEAQKAKQLKREIADQRRLIDI